MIVVPFNFPSSIVLLISVRGFGGNPSTNWKDPLTGAALVTNANISAIV